MALSHIKQTQDILAILLKIKNGFMEYKKIIGGAITDKISIYNCDCMDLLKQTPDNYYGLSLVDPPYGIGESGGKARTRNSKKTNGIKKEWDNQRPSIEYFNELIRVSRNQIIWGGNYFADMLPSSRCWLYWQKNMGGDFADGELAWTSFDQVLRQYTKRSETFNRIHPTQKPVALYKWLLSKYSKQGDKILDTHLGSMSIAIACHDMGFELTGCELDKDYYEQGIARVKKHCSQLSLFEPKELIQNNNQTLF